LLRSGDVVTNRPEADTIFHSRLNAAAKDIEVLLGRLLSSQPEQGEVARPDRLVEVMRYATLGGGKRLRPFLVLESAALFNVLRGHALMVGAALEAIHCYSLVHDDLPAMDDDKLRRGRPTAHTAYDEASAILAGDGLLTFAFDILSRPTTHPDATIRISLISALARAAGVGGMAGGQMLDLAAEGRFANNIPQRLNEGEIAKLQSMKTGALFQFACLSGAILGQANSEQHEALRRYASALGQAFQIADDLLDVEGSTADLGKAAGKDAAAGKATLVAILGSSSARDRLNTLVTEAEEAVESFGQNAAMLKAAAHFIAMRRS
jgi:farnesyl diphosphate synthase